MPEFPTINLEATGANILKLRRQCGITVKQIQEYFGFEQPQAIYKWQRGESLPSVDHLFALSKLLQVSMQEILVESGQVFLCNRKVLLLHKKVPSALQLP